jgi:hypothetical protein
MLDFAIAMGNYVRIKFEEFMQELDIRSIAYGRRLEIMDGKSKIALGSILIPITSTDSELNDEEIIEIYKRRWDIEQVYK